MEKHFQQRVLHNHFPILLIDLQHPYFPGDHIFLTKPGFHPGLSFESITSYLMYRRQPDPHYKWNKSDPDQLPTP